MSGRDRPGPALAGSRHAATYNLRDFGGYRAKSGTLLKQGKLYRSGQLDNAYPEDRGLVARLGIGQILDMRSQSELTTAPVPALDGFDGPILLASAEDGLIPHATRALIGMTAPAEVIAHMQGIYRALPFSIRFMESLRLMFDALAAPEGGVLVHCFAGKDRTGLAVAMAHHVLGVHPDDAMSDYLLTNAMGEERVAAGVSVLRRQLPDTVSDVLIVEAMAVRVEYLQQALHAISDVHGNLDAYLAECIGLAPQLSDLIAVRCMA